jgi:dethiobiotin synthetase
LGHNFTNLDLICALQFRVILVAGGYLGTISHVLTACEALERRGLVPDSIVLSGKLAGPVSLDETRDSIVKFTNVPVHCIEFGARASNALVRLFSH